MRFIQRNFGTTIILTSSDSEECQRADFVAYLRNGKIIEAAPPQTLLVHSHFTTMEQVFRRKAVEMEAQTTCNYERPQQEMTTESGPFLAHSKFSLSGNMDLSKEWLRKKEMRQKFEELFPCPATFLIIFLTMLREKILSTWNNRYFYLFVGVILPNLVVVAFYFGIGHPVDGAPIGLSRLSSHLVECF